MYMYTDVDIDINIDMYIHIYSYMHIYIYIYIYTCTGLVARGSGLFALWDCEHEGYEYRGLEGDAFCR